MKSPFSNRRIEIFFLFSLLLHALIFFLAGLRWPVLDQGEKELEITFLNKYQVADILPPKKEERPDEARFLGAYDSKVEKEQVTKSPPQHKPSSAVSARSDEDNQEEERLDEEKPKKSIAERLDEDNSDSSLEDFYPNYQVGERTYLNVLRYPQISYFVRLKKIFKTTWNPHPVVQRYLYSREVSRGQIAVVIGFNVDRNGNLAKILIIHSSGFPGYDAEALRSVQDSSPFAAPPKELLDEKGELLVGFGFVYYL
ncbi:MAG: energy transducer TonB [bacterium]|nr:energy transducer TonB [bacterium]